MTKTTLRTAFAVATLVFGATACGGDDTADGAADSAADAGEEAAATTVAADEGASGSLVDALAAEMWAEAEDGDSPITSEDEAQCWASGVVDGIGEDRLTELGLTPDNIVQVDQLALTDDEVGIVVDSLFSCADVKTAFVDQFAADFGQEGAECVAEAMDEDLVKEALSASIAGDDSQPSEEFIAAFGQIAVDCGIQG